MLGVFFLWYPKVCLKGQVTQFCQSGASAGLRGWHHNHQEEGGEEGEEEEKGEEEKEFTESEMHSVHGSQVLNKATVFRTKTKLPLLFEMKS